MPDIDPYEIIDQMPKGYIDQMDELLATLHETDPPGAPLLAASVVHADGHVGEGYARAVKARYGLDLMTQDELDAHAAAERRLRFFYEQVLTRCP